MSEKRLVRREDDRLFLGVAAGIGRAMNIDPVVVRILFAVLIMASAGKAALIYLALALFMPKEDLGDAKYNSFDDEEIIIHKSA